MGQEAGGRPISFQACLSFFGAGVFQTICTVYNGRLRWDNQRGFFGNQGMTRFHRRND